MEFDPSYSPSEAFEADDTPLCSNCCDTGTFYTAEASHEFCECEAGCVAEANACVGEDFDDEDDFDYEGGLFEDDADALASMGWGTDEDYGAY